MDNKKWSEVVEASGAQVRALQMLMKEKELPQLIFVVAGNHEPVVPERIVDQPDDYKAP